MNRPLLIIFLTILVNLIGFGIIIPLLPFYAQTFGASPLMVGLLFASFSLAQLFASPVLGAWSDRWGRRPVLIFSLVGTVVSFVMLAVAHSLAMLFAARIVDGLSGGNITTARAYIGDIATDENRAQSFGMLGAAFRLRRDAHGLSARGVRVPRRPRPGGPGRPGRETPGRDTDPGRWPDIRGDRVGRERHDSFTAAFHRAARAGRARHRAV